MDPSRNHRVLRAYQHKLQPPIIPFMPLIVKGNECGNYLKLFLSLFLSVDAFFLHEGNETFVDGLVNFEKMVFKYIFTISLLSFSLSLSLSVW